MLDRTAAELWSMGELAIKDGSTQIVQASTRRYDEHFLKRGDLSCLVVSQMRCLGYDITCNGDTSSMKQRALGCLRGTVHQNSSWLGESFVPLGLKARWWKQQVHGALSWVAPWLIPGKHLTSQLQTISNLGARAIAGIPRRDNRSERLTQVQRDFDMSVPNIFYSLLVGRLGHIFRHSDLIMYNFYNLPMGRLDQLKSQGRSGDLSLSRFSKWICCAQ